jgi:hypothetical protein
MKPGKGDLLDEIKYDANFVKSHTLQPKWYKIFKIFLLLGFLAGYALLFSVKAMLIFLVVFLCLSTVVHFTYRAKTHKFTQTWLDFVVYQEQGETKYKRIGKYYYSAVLANAVIAVIVSQMWG